MSLRATKMREEPGRMTKQYLSDVRLCVTGGSSVGKSAITVRFLTRRFIGEYQRDVEQTYRGFIDVGADTIKYDLKDTARSPDKTFLTTWPTCIAVIYSINDIASFVTASKLLDDIDTTLRQTLNCKSSAPSIALIGNKKDLEHLRNVREEDGRNLAIKHGATFWEVSASEDYYSTYRPLHSLIVKSFENNKDGTSPNSSSSSSPSGNECKTLYKPASMREENVLRRNSEPCNNAALIISSPSLEVDLRNQNGSVNLVHSSPVIRNTIKRRRNKLRENKSKSLDRGTKTASSPSPTTPTSPKTPLNGELSNDNCSYSNITIEVTDTTSTDLPSPTKRSSRSLSVSKNDKKRVIQRKGMGQKHHLTSGEIGLSKSHSFTDLKTLQLVNEQQGRRIVSAKSDLLLNVESETNSNSIHHLNDKENLKETLKSVSTSSFSKFENGKNYWNKLRKDRRKLLTLSLEKVYGDNNEADKIIEPDGKSMNSNCGKKSVRRRISSIFRPRSIEDSPE